LQKQSVGCWRGQFRLPQITPPSIIPAWMDFAVRVADVHGASPEHGVTLDVVTDIPAGRFVDVRLHPGQAARIMTGAPLPPAQKRSFRWKIPISTSGKPGVHAPARVQIYRSTTSGENIRPRGKIFIWVSWSFQPATPAPQRYWIIGITGDLNGWHGAIAAEKSGGLFIWVMSWCRSARLIGWSNPRPKFPYTLIAQIEKYGWAGG